MQEARSVSRFAQKFLEECTPGYYNNEGQIERNINSDAYGPGAVRFFEMLETWRGEGAMTGLELE